MELPYAEPYKIKMVESIKRSTKEQRLNWIKKAYNNGGQESGVVNEHYGDVLFKLGQTDEALKFWIIAKTKEDYSELLDKKIKDINYYE